MLSAGSIARARRSSPPPPGQCVTLSAHQVGKRRAAERCYWGTPIKRAREPHARALARGKSCERSAQAPHTPTQQPRWQLPLARRWRRSTRPSRRSTSSSGPPQRQRQHQLHQLQHQQRQLPSLQVWAQASGVTALGVRPTAAAAAHQPADRGVHITHNDAIACARSRVPAGAPPTPAPTPVPTPTPAAASPAPEKQAKQPKEPKQPKQAKGEAAAAAAAPPAANDAQGHFPKVLIKVRHRWESLRPRPAPRGHVHCSTECLAEQAGQSGCSAFASGPRSSSDRAVPHACAVLACVQVGRVLTVDLIENSDKLYKLSVDLGPGDTRQVRQAAMVAAMPSTAPAGSQAQQPAHAWCWRRSARA